MIQLTRPDIEWLATLFKCIKYLYQEYPELFSKEDEEALLICDQLIKDLYENLNA